MKIKFSWNSSIFSREEILDLLNLSHFELLSLDDQNDQPGVIFIKGKEQYNISSGKTWDDFTRSFLVLSEITKIAKEIEDKKIYGQAQKSNGKISVPFQPISLPEIIFEKKDSPETAKRLIDNLLRIRYCREEIIRKAIKELKKTRNSFASREVGNIRKRMEQCLEI